MRKIYKLISLSLVFIVTLLTASGCGLKVGNEGTSSAGNVELVTTNASTTIRFMNEAIYLGYLGAQRDFALIVDNADYRYNNRECGTGNVGCASTLTKLVINYGVKAALTLSNNLGDAAVGSAENLLIYYTSANDFVKYGDLAPDESWFTKLVGKAVGYADNYGDPLRQLSCGYKGTEHPKMCEYAKEMAENGKSSVAGDSMVLLFHNSQLSYVITDSSLDPTGRLNDPTSGKDNLRLTSDVSFYYDNLINSLKTKVITTQLGVNRSTAATSKQSIKELDKISDLKDLIAGNTGVDDFILLITSEGFIEEKVGTNKDIDGKVISDSTTGEMTDEENEKLKEIMLLLNSVSTFTDNCAVESAPVLNFLKYLLQNFISGSIGALGGAAVGAGAGALIGSIIPGVGTAIGAGVGAIVGAIAGWFIGTSVNEKLEDMMLSANGISETNFCQIMGSALKQVEINVPIYIYNIDSAKDNIKNKDSLDDELKAYYSNNSSCLKQATDVLVPSGMISFFSDELNDKYKYADACEVQVVSDIVGGFGGSPSLLLYRTGENGKPVKADDLYGRVTTELMMEMMSVWGLKTIADIYTLALNSNVNNISFKFGSVQEIQNAKYCISSVSSVSQCDISGYQNVNLNSSYVNVLNANNGGVKVDVTSQYKNYSLTKTDEMLQSGFVPQLNGNNLNVTYMYRDNISGATWESKVAYEVNEEIGSERIMKSDLISDINSTISTARENGGVYQIKYKGNYYILDSHDNVLVCYDKVDGTTYNILYWNQQGKEYLFTDKTGDNLSALFDSILSAEVDKNNISISSAHDFYVHMAYQRTMPNEDGEYPIQYYTFTF